MPRKLRLECAGACYHVFNRGPDPMGPAWIPLVRRARIGVESQNVVDFQKTCEKCGLKGNPVAPVVGVPAVVLESEDADMIRHLAVVDRIGESRDQIPPHVVLDHVPAPGASTITATASSAASKN